MTISPLAPKDGFPNLQVIPGVTFAAAAAGVKYQNRDDVMLAVADAGSTVAGVFTRSSTRSAPVLDCQEKLAHVTSDAPVAILVNSGNANAFTGGVGRASVDTIATAVASAVGTDLSRVFTASTGVIGERLPQDRITDQIDALVEHQSADAADAAAAAIMTTDTFAKGAQTTVQVSGGSVGIVGFAKGSGMIAPDMATMLVYLFTDAAIEADMLQSIVSELNEITFNSITVDSDTSTSDSLMVVATGAGQKIGDADLEHFKAGLHQVMLELAHLVVKDGEGATKFVTVNVTGADKNTSAKQVALSIANSPLVKTAIAGEDPNWGRVVMAVGKSGAPADRDRLSIRFGDIIVAENGWASDSYTEQAGADYMQNSDIAITVDMGLGNGQATVWTCDLTHQYISINADYRS